MKITSRSSDHPKNFTIYTIPQTPIKSDSAITNIDTYGAWSNQRSQGSERNPFNYIIFVKEKLDDENVVIMSEAIDAAGKMLRDILVQVDTVGKIYIRIYHRHFFKDAHTCIQRI